MISRREFLSLTLGLTAGLLFPGPKLSLSASSPQFFFAQFKYRGGEWDPNPDFVEPMIEELENYPVRSTGWTMDQHQNFIILRHN